MSWKFVFRGMDYVPGGCPAVVEQAILNKLAYEGGYRFVCHGNLVYFLRHDGVSVLVEYTNILRSDLF